MKKTLLIVSALLLSVSAQAQSRRYNRNTSSTIDLPHAAEPVSATPATTFKASPINWDAYVDVEGRLPTKEDLVDKGFTLNDAAIYMGKDFTHGLALVELPFYSLYTNGSNAFSFAAGHAQAYVQTNFSPISVRLGQYASFFGLEANDSRDRFFADLGMLKNIPGGGSVVPFTHMGAEIIWVADHLSVRGQVADPNSNSSLATGTDPEAGAQVRYDAGSGFGAFGVEYGQARTTNSNKTNLLVDLLGGLKMDRLNLGGELAIRQVPLSDKTGFGIEASGVYQQSEALGLGARFDYLSSMGVYSPGVPGTGVLDNGFELSVGPSYKLDQELTVRGDLSVGSWKPVGGDTTTLLALTVSLVAHL